MAELGFVAEVDGIWIVESAKLSVEAGIGGKIPHEQVVLHFVHRYHGTSNILFPPLRQIRYHGANAPLNTIKNAPLHERLMRRQFRGQGAGCRAQYPNARFEIVERDGAPIDRIVTARTPDALLIVDIALIASWHRQGIGAGLVNGVLIEARAAGLPVRLSVFASNPAALRFYLRLGFKPNERSGIGMRLEGRDPRPPEAKA